MIAFTLFDRAEHLHPTSTAGFPGLIGSTKAKLQQVMNPQQVGFPAVANIRMSIVCIGNGWLFVFYPSRSEIWGGVLLHFLFCYLLLFLDKLLWGFLLLPAAVSRFSAFSWTVPIHLGRLSVLRFMPDMLIFFQIPVGLKCLFTIPPLRKRRLSFLFLLNPNVVLCTFFLVLSPFLSTFPLFLLGGCLINFTVFLANCDLTMLFCALWCDHLDHHRMCILFVHLCLSAIAYV